MCACSVLSDSATVACQSPLSMEFHRQEYWSELAFSPPRDLPDPGIEHVSLVIGRKILYTVPLLESIK